MTDKSQNTKDEKKKSSAKGVILILLLTAVIIALIFVLTSKFQNSENLSEGVSENVQETEQTVSSNNKTGFPVSFSGEIDTVALTDSSVYVLTDNEVTLLSSNGTVLQDFILNFTDPMIKSSSKYALAYDRQGSGFYLFDRKKVVYEGKSDGEGQIISGYVCDSGKFLIASRHTEATSALTYYSKTGEIIFQWLCTNEHIVSCAVSENGNSLICAALNSEKAKILTKVYYFDISSSKNNREYTFDSTAAIDCFFTSGRNAAVVCSDKRIYIKCAKDDSESVICDYPSSLQKRASDKNGYTAVVTSKAQSPDENILLLYDDSNTLVYQIDISSDIDDIACFGKKVYLLTDNEIIKVSSSGNAETVCEVSAKQDGIEVNSHGIYHFTTSMLYCD